MNAERFMEKELQYQNDLLKVYTDSKELFIRAEECLDEMKFFVAPMLEHRDALEHIMRYMSKKQSGLNEEAIKELDRALGHETRAFFDIADYICITVRAYISKALKGLKSTKISEIWDDYIGIKEQILHVSEEIAEIRNNRRGNVDSVNKYKPAIDSVFKIYADFLTKIEPKIKKRFF